MRVKLPAKSLACKIAGKITFRAILPVKLPANNFTVVKLLVSKTYEGFTESKSKNRMNAGKWITNTYY